MNMLSSLTKLFGKDTAEFMTRNAKQSIEGVVDTKNHFVNTAKNMIKDDPSYNYKLSDELVNDSNLAQRDAMDERLLWSDYINSLDLPDDVSQSVGRAFHKTGINADLLNRAQDPATLAELEARLNPAFEQIRLNQKINPEYGIEDVTNGMIDQSKGLNDIYGSFRNGDALRDDFFPHVKNKQEGFVKDEYDMYIDSQNFTKDYQDYLRLKAWNKFDARDKDIILRSLDGEHGNSIKRMFSIRDEMDKLTAKNVDEAGRRNMLPNYTYKTYDDIVPPILTTVKQADEMASFGAGKILGKIEVEGKTLVRVQPFRDISPQSVQGALKSSGKYSRGATYNLTSLGIKNRASNLAELSDQGYRVKTLVNPITKAEMTVDEARYAFPDEFEDLDIATAVKPLSNKEELMKGRTDYAHNVIAETFYKLYKDKAFKSIRNKVNEGTLDTSSITRDVDIPINKNNPPLFIKTREARYDPVFKTWHHLKDSKAELFEEINEEILKRDYIRIDADTSQHAYGLDYVHKDYATELFGYQHWQMTEGMNWKAQMGEALYRDGIDFVRGNISIKNPAVLLNNTIAGVMMQVTDNVPLALATRNTLEAVGSLKQLHGLKSALFKIERELGDNAIHSPDYIRLKETLNNNIAYQAERDGVLKSFIDEGLWDRKIAANPDEPFDHSFIKNILLTEDSRWGINVRKWHDYSDMMNRIAMYKYLKYQASPKELAKKNIPLEAGRQQTLAIVRRIDDMFVNYSKLLPPMVAAMRRGGSVPFAQWFYRAPAFMLKQIKQHPVRAISIFAAYETLQTLMDDDHDISLLGGEFEDAYIGDVHTDSKYSQNALRPYNWLGAFNQIGYDTDTWLPSYLGKANDGALAAIGITTKEY